MVYALVVAFYASVWKFFATGVSNINVFNVKYCTHLWWKNLLYINNFADPHDQLVSTKNHNILSHFSTLFL